MAMLKKPEILDFYNKSKEKYKTFLNNMKVAVEHNINQKDIKIHKIEDRIKDKKSFINKALNPSKRYSDINQIKDIAGLRIITYVKSDIQPIETLLRDQFEIDEERSENKADILEYNVFDYTSLHLIVSFKQENYGQWFNDYGDLCCEIQIRTVLEQAWAAIFHDTGYKGQVSMEREMKRKFSQFKALLDLADDFFNEIHNKYKDGL